MATKEVKAREAAGEDLSEIIWTPEKPFLLVRRVGDGAAVQFLTCREDFDFAMRKAEKNGEEIMYAAQVFHFKKILPEVKSGFGRQSESIYPSGKFWKPDYWPNTEKTS